MRSGMDMVSIIRKKKAGGALAREEIEYVVRGATEKTLPDYQLSAWLMAVCWRGMDARETTDLTLAMAHSGETVDLSELGGVCVDKHSTGGVGDTTTLILTPLVAACGAPVAKMSGHALGHTGGTLDKLESIPGMGIELGQQAFIAQVRRIGCALVGQTDALAPADKTLYALRDVTGTVESLPLIASSIVSKKLASGAGAIVLDVKTGNGAMMQTEAESIELARRMVDIGRIAGKPMVAVITGMDEPLGSHVGNALEVKEAIDVLAGRVEGPLLEVSLILGALMLVAAGKAPDTATARAKLTEALRCGAGLQKLRQMIQAQGGDPRVADDPSLLPQAVHRVPVPTLRAGYVARMDTVAIGYAAQSLGAGRVTKDDVIDPAVGLVMQVRIGDRVEAGQPLAVLYANDTEHVAEALEAVQRAIVIEDTQVEPPRLIRALVTAEGIIKQE
ncbi:MAG: thymidine phosphorylase [Clostridia bacterium]|nr:thymidine phosphorylase [Clostridia bacterium]